MLQIFTAILKAQMFNERQKSAVKYIYLIYRLQCLQYFTHKYTHRREVRTSHLI